MSSQETDFAKDVRAIEKILLRFGIDIAPSVILQQENDFDVYFEVQPLGAWLVKFRHKNVIFNNCDIILAQMEIDAKIVFCSPHYFWNLVNGSDDINRLIERNQVILEGSDDGIDVFYKTLVYALRTGRGEANIGIGSSNAEIGGDDMTDQLYSPLSRKAAASSSNTIHINSSPLYHHSIPNTRLQSIRTAKTIEVIFQGHMLKKRDVFGGWRQRFFKLFNGRLEYYLHDIDTVPRGVIDIYEAKTYLPPYQTVNISGADHWALIVEPKGWMEKIRLASTHTGDAGYAEVKQWLQCFMLASSRTYNTIAATANRASPMTGANNNRFSPIPFDSSQVNLQQSACLFNVNRDQQQQQFPWQVRSLSKIKSFEGSIVTDSALNQRNNSSLFSNIKAASIKNQNLSNLIKFMKFLFACLCVLIPLVLTWHFKIPIDATLMTYGLAAIFVATSTYFIYVRIIKKKNGMINKAVVFDEEKLMSSATAHTGPFTTGNLVTRSNDIAGLNSTSNRSIVSPSPECDDDSSSSEWDANNEAESPEESSGDSGSDEIDESPSSPTHRRHHSMSLPSTPKYNHSNNNSAPNILPSHKRGASFDSPDDSPRASVIDATILPFETMSPIKRNISSKIAAAFPIKSSSNFNIVDRKQEVKSTEPPDIHSLNAGSGSRRQKLSSSIQAIFKLKHQGPGSNKRTERSLIERSEGSDPKHGVILPMSHDSTHFNPVKLGSSIQCDKPVDEGKANQILRSSSFGQKFPFNFKNLRKASPSHREVSPPHNLRRVEFASDKTRLSNITPKRQTSIHSPADSADCVEL